MIPHGCTVRKLVPVTHCPLQIQHALHPSVYVMIAVRFIIDLLFKVIVYVDFVLVTFKYGV